MRPEYYDLLTFSKDCVAFGRTLGYCRVLLAEVNYSEPKSPGQIKPVKGKVNVVKGGSKEINQAAVRMRSVDILLDPVNPYERFFDTATARMAKEHDVTIGVSLDAILKTNGTRRISLMRNLSFLVSICKKMKADVVLVSGAHDIFGMRTPLDLASVGALLGLETLQARWAVSRVPEAILKKAGLSASCNTNSNHE